MAEAKLPPAGGPAPGRPAAASGETARRLYAEAIGALRAALDRLDESHLAPVAALADSVLRSWRAGGKLLICGNGGSAADSQHIAAELVGRYLRDRPAWAAVALTTDTSILTSVANDYGYEQIFARQVAGLGRPGDVLLVISTSGESANCIAAVAAARRLGLEVHGFLGRGGGRLRDLVDAAFVAPCETTPEIQELHITMGHLLCRLLEERLAAEGGAGGEAGKEAGKGGQGPGDDRRGGRGGGPGGGADA